MRSETKALEKLHQCQPESTAASKPTLLLNTRHPKIIYLGCYNLLQCRMLQCLVEGSGCSRRGMFLYLPDNLLHPTRYRDQPTNATLVSNLEQKSIIISRNHRHFLRLLHATRRQDRSTRQVESLHYLDLRGYQTLLQIYHLPASSLLNSTAAGQRGPYFKARTKLVELTLRLYG